MAKLVLISSQLDSKLVFNTTQIIFICDRNAAKFVMADFVMTLQSDKHRLGDILFTNHWFANFSV